MFYFFRGDEVIAVRNYTSVRICFFLRHEELGFKLKNCLFNNANISFYVPANNILSFREFTIRFIANKYMNYLMLKVNMQAELRFIFITTKRWCKRKFFASA